MPPPVGVPLVWKCERKVFDWKQEKKKGVCALGWWGSILFEGIFWMANLTQTGWKLRGVPNRQRRLPEKGISQRRFCFLTVAVFAGRGFPLVSGLPWWRPTEGRFGAFGRGQKGLLRQRLGGKHPRAAPLFIVRRWSALRESCLFCTALHIASLHFKSCNSTNLECCFWDLKYYTAGTVTQWNKFRLFKAV